MNESALREKIGSYPLMVISGNIGTKSPDLEVNNGPNLVIDNSLRQRFCSFNLLQISEI